MGGLHLAQLLAEGMRRILLIVPKSLLGQWQTELYSLFGIETREGFIPANQQEIFLARGWTRNDDCPRANAAASTTFYIPSSPTLTRDEIA